MAHKPTPNLHPADKFPTDIPSSSRRVLSKRTLLSFPYFGALRVAVSACELFAACLYSSKAAQTGFALSQFNELRTVLIRNDSVAGLELSGVYTGSI